MKSAWPLKELGQLAEVERRSILPSSICDTDFYIGLEDIKSGSGEILSYRNAKEEKLKSNKFRFSNKHILYGKLRPYLNKVALPEKEGVCSTDILPVKPKEGVADRLYLAYLMRSDYFSKTATERASGANLPRISPTEIEKIKIPAPDMKAQKALADILHKAEISLKKRRKAIRLLDDFLKSTFLEMFGDPAINTKKLPAVKCSSISTHVTSGSTPLGGNSTYLKKGILFIRSQNIHMNRLVFDDIAYIDESVHNRMKRTWVKRNDVLLNITGASIGRVAYFNGVDDTANVNQHVCIIRPNLQQVLPEYLSFLISMPNFQKKVLSGNAGATRQAFNFEQIKNFIIPLAKIENQKKFAAIVDSVEKLKQKMKSSETELQNLFNCLMQKAFKGELF